MYFVPWLLIKAWILPLPNTIQEQANEAIKYGFDGVVIYINQANNKEEFYTAGWHNKEEKITSKHDALFKIASISKLYDAVAVTKLVQQGKLSLNESISYYLPELEGRMAYSQQITLKHLLQHKSGIPNFTATPNYWKNPKVTYQESINLILDKPANFKPGEDYEYCNTNYLILNKIMDSVLGYSNFIFKKDQILDKLQLKNTFGPNENIDLNIVMSGYHKGYPFDLKEEKNGMHATAKDVGLFIRALNNGTLLNPEENETYNSLYKKSHSGWVPGYQSFANYYPEIDVIIVIFYNTTDSDLYYWNLSEIINARILDILKKNTV